MSAWLVTQDQRFKAAVAGSPVTDWYSFTFTTNIARWGLWFGGALVLLAAVLIGIDVLMRKFLDRSIGGADELAGYSLAI